MLGFGVGSNLRREQRLGPEGPAVDEHGNPEIIDILDLVFIDQRTGDSYIFPLPPDGVQAVKAALEPNSGIIVPKHNGPLML
jgi:hypothetical protein